MLHWDGGTWRQEPAPVPGDMGVQGMFVFDQARPIVTGNQSVQQWNGSTWVSLPLPGWPFVTAPSVWQDSSGASWIAGGPAILRYDAENPGR